MNIVELICKLRHSGGDECFDLIEKLQSGNIKGIEQVGWQQRYIDKEEGPSVWQFCDDRTAAILKGRVDYELRPVYA